MNNNILFKTTIKIADIKKKCQPLSWIKDKFKFKKQKVYLFSLDKRKLGRLRPKMCWKKPNQNNLYLSQNLDLSFGGRYRLTHFYYFFPIKNYAKFNWETMKFCNCILLCLNEFLQTMRSALVSFFPIFLYNNELSNEIFVQLFLCFISLCLIVNLLLNKNLSCNNSLLVCFSCFRFSQIDKSITIRNKYMFGDWFWCIFLQVIKRCM